MAAAPLSDGPSTILQTGAVRFRFSKVPQRPQRMVFKQRGGTAMRHAATRGEIRMFPFCRANRVRTGEISVAEGKMNSIAACSSLSRPHDQGAPAPRSGSCGSFWTRMISSAATGIRPVRRKSRLGTSTDGGLVDVIECGHAGPPGMSASSRARNRIAGNVPVSFFWCEKKPAVAAGQPRRPNKAMRKRPQYSPL